MSLVEAPVAGSNAADDKLRALAVVPWFDDPTAYDLMELQNAGRSIDHQRVLAVLEREGVLVREGHCRRVSEPIRQELREVTYAESFKLYRDALRVYVKHAQNGLRPKLQDLMGSHGTAVNLYVARMVAHDDDQAFNDLVDSVRNSDSNRERQDALTAANLIQYYAFKRDRRVEFFRGLHLWLSGERVAAKAAFDVVLEERRLDKAGAIAAHLVGVFKYGEGDLGDAEDLLSQAISDLRQLDDLPGLIMTLTTFGRLKRDLYREHRKGEHLDESVLALREALTTSRGLERRDSKLEATCAISLAQSLTLVGETHEAMRLGQSAVLLVPSGELAVWARSMLATIYRDAGQQKFYAETIDDAILVAQRDEVADKSFARVLNMSAASHRREGNYAIARRHARESLRLGRKLKDLRHVAHASHTLAAIYVDTAARADSEWDDGARSLMLKDAEDLLFESRRTLASFRNTSGIEMVEATLRRLSAARDSIDDTTN